MKLRAVRLWPIVPAVLGLAMAGCGGDGLDRQAVSGTVKLDGQPLDYGSIQFESLGSELTMSGGSLIQEGRYEISREQGLVPGTYKVAVYAPVRTKQDHSSELPVVVGGLPKDRIPAKYNMSTTLTIEVEDGGENVFPFDLESSGP